MGQSGLEARLGSRLAGWRASISGGQFRIQSWTALGACEIQTRSLVLQCRARSPAARPHVLHNVGCFASNSNVIEHLLDTSSSPTHPSTQRLFRSLLLLLHTFVQARSIWPFRLAVFYCDPVLPSNLDVVSITHVALDFQLVIVQFISEPCFSAFDAPFRFEETSLTTATRSGPSGISAQSSDKSHNAGFQSPR